MPFTFNTLVVPDVIAIQPKVFSDERGYFAEIFKNTDFIAAGITKPFVQINQSKSSNGVIRGLHFQKAPKAQGKLVRALSGVIFDVAVDIRKASATYGKWVGIELSSETKNMVYVPEGFAHGFSVLSETAEIEYFCTNVYAPECEVGIAYNDPVLNIDWKVKTAIVSARDQSHKKLSEILTF